MREQPWAHDHKRGGRELENERVICVIWNGLRVGRMASVKASVDVRDGQREC